MKPLTLIFILLFTANIFSQNYVDILKLNYGSSVLNQFDSSSVKTRLQEFTADLTLPLVLNDRHAIVSGFIFEDYKTKLFPDQAEKTFGALTLKAGLKKDFNEKWTGTFVFLPKVSADQPKFNGKDFQFGGLVLMKYQKKENLNYKFGLYYNSELFGPFFVPMFGMYYLSNNKKFETTILLPLTVDMNYQLHKWLNAGIAFNGQIRSYHLSEHAPATADTYLSRSTNEAFTYLRFNLSKNLMLQTRVGQTFARKYRVYGINDQVNFGLPLLFIGGKRTQLNSDFSDGLIFQASLILRVFTNKEASKK